MKIRRLLSWLLTVIMLLSMLPSAMAYAMDYPEPSTAGCPSPDATGRNGGNHFWNISNFSQWPTCTEAGYIEYECVYCRQTERINLPANGHIWNVTGTEEPGCTRPGAVYYACSVCGATQVETLPALGHEWVNEGSQEATCTEPGYDHWYCFNCGESYDNYTPALGHDWAREPMEEPTCTEAGYDQLFCDRCGEEGDIIILPALGHDWAREPMQRPTCTEAGYDQLFCNRCGEEGDIITLPALGHDWGPWTVTQEVTCGREGITSRTCSRCGKTERETTPALEHDFGPWEIEYPPKDGQPGMQRRVCRKCGYTEYRYYYDNGQPGPDEPDGPTPKPGDVIPPPPPQQPDDDDPDIVKQQTPALKLAISGGLAAAYPDGGLTDELTWTVTNIGYVPLRLGTLKLLYYSDGKLTTAEITYDPFGAVLKPGDSVDWKTLLGVSKAWVQPGTETDILWGVEPAMYTVEGLNPETGEKLCVSSQDGVSFGVLKDAKDIIKSDGPALLLTHAPEPNLTGYPEGTLTETFTYSVTNIGSVPLMLGDQLNDSYYYNGLPTSTTDENLAKGTVLEPGQTVPVNDARFAVERYFAIPGTETATVWGLDYYKRTVDGLDPQTGEKLCDASDEIIYPILKAPEDQGDGKARLTLTGTFPDGLKPSYNTTQNIFYDLHVTNAGEVKIRDLVGYWHDSGNVEWLPQTLHETSGLILLPGETKVDSNHCNNVDKANDGSGYAWCECYMTGIREDTGETVTSNTWRFDYAIEDPVPDGEAGLALNGIVKGGLKPVYAPDEIIKYELTVFNTGDVKINDLKLYNRDPVNAANFFGSDIINGSLLPAETKTDDRFNYPVNYIDDGTGKGWDEWWVTGIREDTGEEVTSNVWRLDIDIVDPSSPDGTPKEGDPDGEDQGAKLTLTGTVDEDLSQPVDPNSSLTLGLYVANKGDVEITDIKAYAASPYSDGAPLYLPAADLDGESLQPGENDTDYPWFWSVDYITEGNGHGWMEWYYEGVRADNGETVRSNTWRFDFETDQNAGALLELTGVVNTDISKPVPPDKWIYFDTFLTNKSDVEITDIKAYSRSPYTDGAWKSYVYSDLDSSALAPGKMGNDPDWIWSADELDDGAGHGWMEWYYTGIRADTGELVKSNVWGFEFDIDKDGEREPDELDASLYLTGDILTGYKPSFTTDEYIDYQLHLTNTGDVQIVNLRAINDGSGFYAGWGEESGSAYAGASILPGETLDDPYSDNVGWMNDGGKGWQAWYVEGERTDTGETVKSNVWGFDLGIIEEGDPQIVLTVTQTSPKKESYVAGDEIEFDFTVTNVGDRECTLRRTGAYAVPNTGSPMAWSEDVEYDLIPAGGTYTDSGKLKLDSAFLDGDTFKYFFIAQASDVGDGELKYISNDVPLTFKLKDDYIWIPPTDTVGTDVKVEKTVISTPAMGSAYTLGEEITYQITVTNKSTYDLKDVEIADPLKGMNEDAVIDVLPTFAKGATVTYTFTYNVDQQNVNDGFVQNQATVTWPDPGTGNPVIAYSNTVTVPVAGPVKPITLSAYKAVANTAPHVDDMGNPYYAQGDIIRFRVDVVNETKQTFTNVTVYDPLAPGDHIIAYFPVMYPGETQTILLDYEVTFLDVISGEVCNVAIATGTDENGETKSATSNEASAPTGGFFPTVGPMAMVVKKELSKPKNGGYYEEGETIAYSITVTNVGDVDLTDVVVTDALAKTVGGEIGSIEILHPGESRSYLFKYKVTGPNVDDGYVLNLAGADYNAGYYYDFKMSNPVISPTGDTTPGGGTPGGGTPGGGTPGGGTPGGGTPGGGIPTITVPTEPVIPTLEMKNGEDQPCSLTLTGKGSGHNEYARHTCLEHTEIAETVAKLVDEAKTVEERAAAWTTGRMLWTKSIEEMYGDIFSGTKDAVAIQAIITERAMFFRYADAHEKKLAAELGGDTEKVARAMNDMMAEKCRLLCYEAHTAPQDRADSFRSSVSAINASAAALCAVTETPVDRQNAVLDVTLCEKHADIDRQTKELLSQAMNDADLCNTAVKLQRMWSIALDEQTNAAYKAADRQARNLISADRGTFDNWLKARKALLECLYPTNSPASAEALMRDIMNQVIGGCEAAK